MMMETLENDPRLALAQDIAGFYDNPLGFVLYVFPWGKPGFLEHHTGPDAWQIDVLRRLGEEVRARKFNGHTPVAPVRMCVCSGHGIGKSVLAAWLVLWIMATRPHCRGVVTAFHLSATKYSNLGGSHSMVKDVGDRELV